jgi:hypothetical protein
MNVIHTPGPWELDPADAAHVTDEDYHVIRAGCGFLAESKEHRKQGFRISGHMSASDARLISAAPRLLAALSEIVQYLADSDEEGLIEHSETMIRARAALAAAGEPV